MSHNPCTSPTPSTHPNMGLLSSSFSPSNPWNSKHLSKKNYQKLIKKVWQYPRKPRRTFPVSQASTRGTSRLKAIKKSRLGRMITDRWWVPRVDMQKNSRTINRCGVSLWKNEPSDFEWVFLLTKNGSLEFLSICGMADIIHRSNQ